MNRKMKIFRFFCVLTPPVQACLQTGGANTKKGCAAGTPVHFCKGPLAKREGMCSPLGRVQSRFYGFPIQDFRKFSAHGMWAGVVLVDAVFANGIILKRVERSALVTIVLSAYSLRRTFRGNPYIIILNIAL